MNPSPADLARWAFWVPLRRAIHPDHPLPVHLLRAGWRARHLAARGGRALMEDEYRRWFGDRRSSEERGALVREAYRIAWRVHLEELLLGRLDAANVERWLTFRGLEYLDAALARGRGVVWVYPHAGAVMLMLAGLALRGYPYTQYAARGLAPEEVARDHPELLATNRWREAVRRAREADEDRLPARFLTLRDSPRELYRRLAANELVGIAYDGRIGNRWEIVPYLERRALLNPGPWRLAVSTGAAVVPAFCRTPDDGPAVCEVGAPILPGRDPAAVRDAVLQVEEEWLRRWPEEYGVWLLHTRVRNGIDDHPLFVDHAADARWRRWVKVSDRDT